VPATKSTDNTEQDKMLSGPFCADITDTKEVSNVDSILEHFVERDLQNAGSSNLGAKSQTGDPVSIW